MLCNVDVQREVISAGAQALSAASSGHSSPSLFGTRNIKTELRQRNLTVAELFSKNVDTEPRAPRVAGYYQNVALRENNRLVLAWSAITVMALFPECARKVASQTQANRAAYFYGNEKILPLPERIIALLAGSDVHVAKTPMEVVLLEWQLFDRL